MTGKPATAMECILLFTKLSHEGEQALNAVHEDTAADLIVYADNRSQFQAEVSFFLPSQPSVIYYLKLAGFEAVRHQVHGLVMEYIGSIFNERTRAPEKLRLGVCEERKVQLYVKRSG